jgi:hypothetical protein
MCATKRFGVSLIPGVVAASAWLATMAGAGGGDFKPLFNGKDLTGWKIVLQDTKVDPAAVVQVKDGELQMTGYKLNGYVHTERPYKNYVLRYMWTFPKDQPEKTSMNSGCLVHIQPPHKVYPKSVEPQGRYMDHGKLFFIGFGKDDKKESTFDAEALKKAVRPSYEWNSTEVTAGADGSVEVRVNGTPVSRGKTELTEGPIGFQAEGARIHFKQIEIKELK